MLRGSPEHYTGHNPAGALAIVALLGLALAVTADCSQARKTNDDASSASCAGRWTRMLTMPG
jgi:cytochrome b